MDCGLVECVQSMRASQGVVTTLCEGRPDAVTGMEVATALLNVGL